MKYRRVCRSWLRRHALRSQCWASASAMFLTVTLAQKPAYGISWLTYVLSAIMAFIAYNLCLSASRELKGRGEAFTPLKSRRERRLREQANAEAVENARLGELEVNFLILAEELALAHGLGPLGAIVASAAALEQVTTKQGSLESSVLSEA